MNPIYEIDTVTIAGEHERLERYRGEVMLIVNTATGCGFAPQLRELDALYKAYKERGVHVLGFPCSQFANQELDDNAKIQEVCQLNFGVTFPLYAKVDVKGSNIHPLFALLTKEAPGLLGSKVIKWNFTKFLVDREGKIRQRFAPATDPKKITAAIDALL